MNKETGTYRPKEAMIPQEIERKFIVKSAPEDLQDYPKKEILQGYLSVDDHSETRIRKQDEHHVLTIKKGSGLVRDEKEISITEGQFKALWPQTEGKRIAKERYSIPQGNATIEIDVFKGQLEGLVLADVEFASIEESKRFSPPSWLGKEVTEEKGYKNQQLAKLDSWSASRNDNSHIVREKSSEAGVRKLLNKIESKRAEKGDEPVIVMIAGRTSSGKTTAVTSEITRMYGEEARVLSMDDYSKGNSFVDEMARKGTPINWDHPAYIDFELLNQHIKALKRGEAIDKPTFSFKTGERAESERFEPGKVIVVEGLFALRDEIQQHGDVKAFVDISLHGSVIRRLLRDVKRTNMQPVDIMRYYLTTVEPMYQEHIVQTKENADVVLVNEYNPKHEAGRSEVYEVQTKFKTPEDIKTRLQRAGAEYLGQVQEEDTYLEPTDKNFSQSDELIRIRKKGENIILGYKGPRIESSVRTRAKFEFEIDEDIEKNILEKYGEKVTDVSKLRSLYQLDGLIIAVDTSVMKKQGSECKPLGSFMEMRSTDQEQGEEKIKSASQRLGLDYEKKIISSYSEM